MEGRLPGGGQGGSFPGLEERYYFCGFVGRDRPTIQNAFVESFIH